MTSIGFFIVFIVIITLLGNLIMTQYVLSKTVVTVPDFVGTDVDNAKNLAEYLSLIVEVADYEYSDLPNGRIISQIPSKDRPIYKNRSISVIVSKGPKQITIPILTGFSYQNLDDVFRVYDIKLGEVKQHYSNVVPAGFVINTIPGHGTNIMAGRTVDVIISIGQDPLTRKPPVRQPVIDIFEDDDYDDSDSTQPNGFEVYLEEGIF
jgi:serine/threonine-protein kinase